MQSRSAHGQYLSHDIGASIFGSDIAGYEAGRIGYPRELFEVLLDRFPVADGDILEIAPGTGLATLDLIDRLKPVRIVAVEADPKLSDHLAGKLAALDSSTTAVVLNDRFEQSRPGTGFDLVCCAAAFHWLQPELALPRIAQALAPGGTLALWWNTYRQSGVGDAFADRITPLLAQLRLAPSEGAKGHNSLNEADHRSLLERAGFSDFEAHLFRRDRKLTTEQVVTLYASYSYVRALDPADRYDVLAEIAEIAENEFEGLVPNMVLTALYLGRKPPHPIDGQPVESG